LLIDAASDIDTITPDIATPLFFSWLSWPYFLAPLLIISFLFQYFHYFIFRHFQLSLIFGYESHSRFLHFIDLFSISRPSSPRFSQSRHPASVRPSQTISFRLVIRLIQRQQRRRQLFILAKRARSEEAFRCCCQCQLLADTAAFCQRCTG